MTQVVLDGIDKVYPGMADRIAVLRDGLLEDVGTPEQIYQDPATVFVAAFLSTPPINLLQARAWVQEGQSVLLDLGPQRLTIPAHDPRAAAMISHHGAPVIVGIRPDALTLATGTSGTSDTKSADGAGRAVLSGCVRALEFHGSDWLAYAEAGIATADPNEVGRAHAAASPDPGPSGLAGRMRGLLGLAWPRAPFRTRSPRSTPATTGARTWCSASRPAAVQAGATGWTWAST